MRSVIGPVVVYFTDENPANPAQVTQPTQPTRFVTHGRCVDGL